MLYLGNDAVPDTVCICIKRMFYFQSPAYSKIVSISNSMTHCSDMCDCNKIIDVATSPDRPQILIPFGKSSLYFIKIFIMSKRVNDKNALRKQSIADSKIIYLQSILRSYD